MDTEIIPAPDSQETILAMNNNHSQGKKPKLENIAKHSDLLDMYERSDLIDIESSVSIDTSGCQTLKNALLGNQWLNSDQMYNVNKLMLDAKYTVNGFQDTMLAPILQKNGRWHIAGDGFTCQKPPSANIHYNSQQHWVTSFQFENGDIYLLDSSLGQKMESCLNDSLKKFNWHKFMAEESHKLLSKYLTYSSKRMVTIVVYLQLLICWNLLQIDMRDFKMEG